MTTPEPSGHPTWFAAIAAAVLTIAFMIPMLLGLMFELMLSLFGAIVLIGILGYVGIAPAVLSLFAAVSLGVTLSRLRWRGLARLWDGSKRGLFFLRIVVLGNVLLAFGSVVAYCIHPVRADAEFLVIGSVVAGSLLYLRVKGVPFAERSRGRLHP